MIIMIYRKNPKPSQAHPERRKQVWTEQTAGGPTKQDFKLSERVKLFTIQLHGLTRLFIRLFIPSLEGNDLYFCWVWECFWCHRCQEALPKSRTLSNKGRVRLHIFRLHPDVCLIKSSTHLSKRRVI